MTKARRITIAGEAVAPGETRDIALKVSETYMGVPVEVPVRVIRGRKRGPCVLLTGAIHGDELIGTGIIREIMFSELNLQAGTLVCIPVTNIFGFENHSRYLPDRRDLNRSFPGSDDGSLAFRLADALFTQVITHCDYAIDMHTAATRRTNVPHVRGDLNIPGVRDIALAFGCELVLHKKGSEKTLRSAACAQGCATILFEAGEVLKFEPVSVKIGMRGVLNVLKSLNMVSGKPVRPAYQTRVRKTVWIRADAGGLLRFYVQPGELIDKGAPLASCDSFFANEPQVINSPVSGVVLGMTTLPAVKPGEPVCHIAVPTRSLDAIRAELDDAPRTLHRRAERDLGTSFVVEDSEDAPTS